MTPATFQLSRADRCTELAARVAVGLAGVAVVVWGARHGISGLVVAAALLCGPLFWAVARQGWRTAWRIVVSDQHIEATRIGAVRVRLTWDGIGEVQHFVRASIQGPIRLLRLVSIDRQREIIFNDRLPRFDELMRLVEAGVRHVGPGEPSAWGRVLWSKPARWSDVSGEPSAPGEGGVRARQVPARGEPARSTAVRALAREAEKR